LGDISIGENAPLVRRRAPVGVIAVLAAVVSFVSYPVGGKAAIAAFTATVLVVLAATDLERRIIPNRVVLPATLIVLVMRVAFFPDQSPEFILAAAGAGLAFLIPNLISPSLMGMGDVKLAAFLGVALGRGVVGAVMVAFFSLFPFALATLIRGGKAARKATLPFGPFLAFGGMVVLIVPRLT
jgi:leader peptidase (prepilin peptidase)/N-methyltransferase